MPDTSSCAPLARRHDDDFVHPALVWWALLDQRYIVEAVRRPDGPGAALRIWDHQAGDRLVVEHPVTLADDAEFGPAIEDVVLWQRLAVESVDGPKHRTRKEKRS